MNHPNDVVLVPSVPTPPAAMISEADTYLGLLIVAILWAFFSGAVVAVSEHEASSQKSATLGGLLRCGFAGWGLLLVEVIVRNSAAGEHPLARRVCDDVLGGEVVRRIHLPRTRGNRGKRLYRK